MYNVRVFIIQYLRFGGLFIDCEREVVAVVLTHQIWCRRAISAAHFMVKVKKKEKKNKNIKEAKQRRKKIIK